VEKSLARSTRGTLMQKMLTRNSRWRKILRVNKGREKGKIRLGFADSLMFIDNFVYVDCFGGSAHRQFGLRGQLGIWPQAANKMFLQWCGEV
jgi:hypothetical protein